MSKKFEEFLNRLGFEPLSFEFDNEKPYTLSFELASFVAHVSRFAEITASNGRDEPLQLHVGATTELNGNAFASVLDGSHYIGITFGHFLSSCYHSIQAFFMTKAFDDIGNAPENHESKIELCPQSGFWSVDGLTAIQEFAGISTDDLARIWGAYFLNYAMTMLAFYHEFFHIYLGHCRLMSDLGLRGRILEVGDIDLSDAEGRISRSFEAVADQNAIILSIQMILADHDLPTVGKVAKITMLDRIRLTLVAAGLLTTSWFAWQKRVGLKAISHPAPGARFLHFYCTAQEALSDLGRGELFKEAASKALDDLASISVRCPDLSSAMASIANGQRRSQSIESIPEHVMVALEIEAFRSR